MNTPKKNNNPKATNYLALSFQMGLFIFLGTYGGMLLDKATGIPHVFAVVFSLLAVTLSLVYIVRKELKRSKNNQNQFQKKYKSHKNYNNKKNNYKYQKTK